MRHSIGNYTPTVWYNYTNTSSPLNADNLNKIDQAIDVLDDEAASSRNRMIDLQSNVDVLQSNVNDLSELKDVKLTSVQDGDVPMWNAHDQKWENGVADMGLFVENGILMCRYSNWHTIQYIVIINSGGTISWQ